MRVFGLKKKQKMFSAALVLVVMENKHALSKLDLKNALQPFSNMIWKTPTNNKCLRFGKNNNVAHRIGFNCDGKNTHFPNWIWKMPYKHFSNMIWKMCYK